MELNILNNDGKTVTLSGFSKITDVLTVKRFENSVVIVPRKEDEIANRTVVFIEGHTSNDSRFVTLITECCGIGETQFLDHDGAYYQIH